MTIKLTRKEKNKVLKSVDLYCIMQRILMRENKIDRNKEHMWVIGLGNRHHLLFIELISLGTLNRTLAEPVDVFSWALQKQASRVILVHNHPSGDLEPSAADIELTDQLAAIGRFVNVPVLDHLIISLSHYYSFADEGIMQKIEEETRYDLTMTKEKLSSMKNEVAEPLLREIDRLQAKEKREVMRVKKEMARKALQEGISIEQIIKISGLSKKQIVNLNK